MIPSPTAYRQSVFRDMLIHRRTGMWANLPKKPAYQPKPRRGCTAVIGSALTMLCFTMFIVFLLGVMSLLFIIAFYPGLWESFTIQAKEMSL